MRFNPGFFHKIYYSLLPLMTLHASSMLYFHDFGMNWFGVVFALISACLVLSIEYLLNRKTHYGFLIGTAFVIVGFGLTVSGYVTQEAAHGQRAVLYGFLNLIGWSYLHWGTRQKT
jgi:hypothetical protein